MSDAPLGAQLVRRAQIGAAVGALGLDGAALQPLVETFGPELAHHVALACPGDLDRLRVSTLVEGEHRGELLAGLIEMVYDASEDVGAWSREAGTLLGPHAVRVGVEALARRPGEAGLRIGLARAGGPAWDRRRVASALRLLEVGQAALDGMEALYGRLQVAEASEIAVWRPEPSAAPRLEVRLPLWATRERAGEAAASLAHAADAVGVGEKQRTWIRRVYPLFADAALNDTPVTLTLRPDGLVRELRVDFHVIAARKALQVLGLAHPSPARPLGATLGALSGALGLEADVVNVLSVTLTEGALPRVGFELRSDRLPEP